MNYEHTSHSHCWESTSPPCGLTQKHRRCCLCDLSAPTDTSDWPTRFLNAGTELLGIDCSALISVVSKEIEHAWGKGLMQSVSIGKIQAEVQRAYFEQGQAAERERIIALAEGMKKDVPTTIDPNFGHLEIKANNAALDTLISKIKE